MTRGWRWVLGGAIAAMLAGWAAQAPAQSAPVKMEWLSWSIFRFTSPTGKVIVTNPFVTNPDSPVKVPDFPKVDVILVADGHRDEVGSTRRDRDQDRGEDRHALRDVAGVLPAAQRSRGAAAPEQSRRLVSAGWPDDPQRQGRARVGDRGQDERRARPWGSCIHFENGLTVYFAGSTALTMDMQLWGMLYKPDVAILPLSANRDVQDIVHMVRLLRTENPNLKTIIPHHHRLQPPPGAPTPAAMEAALKTAGLPVTVLNPDLSKVYDLTK